MTGALRRRRGRVAAIAMLLAGAVLSAAAAPGHRPALRALSTPAPPRAPAAPVAAAPSGPEPALVEQPVGLVPPPPFSEHPLRPHEIFGFAPYWSLGMAGGYPLRELTTVAYFGVDVAADGSLQQSGEGWSGYVSPELTALVGRAHAAGAGVVLTAKQFDAGTLHRLVNDPAAAPRLGHALVDAIRARGMDGANLDLEGLDGADRAAFATFAVSVSSALHAVNPRWQVTVDTYTNSAWDTAGYFDVARIAPAVDALFVMAYDMQGDNPSPVAPLRGARLNDAQSVAAYRATVGASKVILGVPFYGVDWPTSGGDRTATATGKPQPVTYAQLADAGHPRYWDPDTASPWTSFQDAGGQWHQAYYEDPQSIAMKAELADAAHLRGVGIWALGMDGNDPAMARALLGRAAPVKLALGPVPTPAGAPPPAQAAAAPRRSPGAPGAPPTARPQPPRPPQPVPGPTLVPLPSPGPVPGPPGR
jgi:hypothetical protein